LGQPRRGSFSITDSRCPLSPALDGGAFAFGLHPNLLAEIVADRDPHMLSFPMDTDLAMVPVELYGVLPHDRDCKAGVTGPANGLICADQPSFSAMAFPAHPKLCSSAAMKPTG
jgi:hypothetical protein